MTKQILLTPAEEMMCLKELLAAEGDDDRRSEVAEKMLALHYQQQRAEYETYFVIYKLFNQTQEN